MFVRFGTKDASNLQASSAIIGRLIDKFFPISDPTRQQENFNKRLQGPPDSIVPFSASK